MLHTRHLCRLKGGTEIPVWHGISTSIGIISQGTTSMKKILTIFFLCMALTAIGQTAVETMSLEQLNMTERSLSDTSFPGDYALIAGGSKGIGYGIAEALAKRKFNLVLIARHMDSLMAAKNKLEKAYNIHVELLQFDLSEEVSATQIAKWCTEKNIRLKMLCNVAGFGGEFDYLSLDIEKLRYMVRLNIESAMSLTLALLPLLEKNKPAYILNVSSMAAFAPIPKKNMYSATKSALSFFSYSLKYQLKEKDISVSLLCPGPVYTKPEIIKDTRQTLGWFGDKMALMPDRVGEVAVRRTLKGRFMIIPGTVAKVSSVFIRVMPTRWMTALYGKAGKKKKNQSTVH
jgi:uncharacterized protein